MQRVIWRTKIHPGAPTEVPGLLHPRVITVDLDGSQDISVWFEHTVTDAGQLVGDAPVQDLDDVDPIERADLLLLPIETGAAVPPGTKHVGSVTHPALVRHVYASLRPTK